MDGLEVLLVEQCTDKVNSLRNRAHIARHLNTFLSNMERRPEPNGIADYMVTCDRSNNPEDNVAYLAVNVMIKLDEVAEFIHFPFIMKFDQPDLESDFDRAMRGI